MFDSATAVDRHCPAQFGAQVGDQCAIQFHSLHPHMESCKAGRVHFKGLQTGEVGCIFEFCCEIGMICILISWFL